ncbi:MAG: hypothetical protein JWM36_4892 [Hyphomicrobiales bacterium]|nr:hypothetical protein [Hyphomicrobiales bacterium]
MTTDQQQAATNAKAERNLAAKLAVAGWHGDPHTAAAAIARELHADGWRALEKPVAARGPGATRAAIDDAVKAAREAVEAAREKRKGPAEVEG